jgi:hypothetical protein
MTKPNRIQYSKEELLNLKDKLPKIADGTVYNGYTTDTFQSYLLKCYSNGKPTSIKLTSEQFDLFFSDPDSIEQDFVDSGFRDNPIFQLIENIIFYLPLDQIPKHVNDMPEIVRWRYEIGK